MTMTHCEFIYRGSAELKLSLQTKRASITCYLLNECFTNNILMARLTLRTINIGKIKRHLNIFMHRIIRYWLLKYPVTKCYVDCHQLSAASRPSFWWDELQVEAREEKIASLEAEGKPEKAAALRENLKWDAAVQRSQGLKVKVRDRKGGQNTAAG